MKKPEDSVAPIVPVTRDRLLSVHFRKDRPLQPPDKDMQLAGGEVKLVAILDVAAAFDDQSAPVSNRLARFWLAGTGSRIIGRALSAVMRSVGTRYSQAWPTRRCHVVCIYALRPAAADVS